MARRSVRHLVAVVAYEGGQPGATNPEAMIKLTIPARYAQATSSGLALDVKPGQLNKVTFELSSREN